MHSIFSDQNGMKFKMNKRRKMENSQIKGDKLHAPEQPVSQRRN